MWLLGNLKLPTWLTLYFYWTALIWNKGRENHGPQAKSGPLFLQSRTKKKE